MSAPVHDPKNLTDWLELDYFNRPRPLGLWLGRLSWCALGITALGVAWSLLYGSRRVYQAGPLSTAHAMFANDCAKCHSESFPTLARFVGDGAVHSVPDASCLQCHPGPDHHPPLATSSGCASCHKEHRGRVALARVPDAHCTDCHANLKGNPQTHVEDVASFAGHPEFALWRPKKGAAGQSDPGAVLFSHKRHLGLMPEDAGAVTHRPAELVAKVRKEIGDLQQKQCAACHQTDDAGRYMKPIRYEQHCANCHPLLVDVKPPPKLPPAADRRAREPVPHPKGKEDAGTVRALLRERYLRIAQQFPAVLGPTTRDEPERPLPGGWRGRVATAKELDFARGQLPHAERLLFDGAGGCRHCHTEKTEPHKRPDGLPDYGTQRIPERWLEKSVYSHKAHRMLQCTECHALSTPGGKKDVRESAVKDDVLMPKIADCRRCHSAAGGARTDCAECHTYHPRSREHAWKGSLRIAD